MAITEQIGGTDTERVFLDTDVQKRWKVADYDTDATGATAKDVTGFALTFDIRKRRTSSTALVTKSVGTGLTISGTFDAVLASSTQYVTLALAASDLSTASFGSGGGTFYYSLKRTDAGSETILAEGAIVIERATQA